MSPAKPEFDVASDAPVLFHASGEVEGVPARDLSANDLARLAWLATGQHKTPAEMSQEVIAKWRDKLVATGAYATKPRPEAGPPAG